MLNPLQDASQWCNIRKLKKIYHWYRVVFFCFCFFNFVMQPHWWSPTRGISQIWLRVREKSQNKFQNPATIWLPAWTYCLNMTISENKNHEIWGLSVQFFTPQNSFVWVVHWDCTLGYFSSPKCQKIAQRKRENNALAVI